MLPFILGALGPPAAFFLSARLRPWPRAALWFGLVPLYCLAASFLASSPVPFAAGVWIGAAGWFLLGLRRKR